ncbi:MAG: tyrosine-type recombinase/integrase [Methyloceanibacter sp.]|uniref:tyrosine-type recombinase/integrase n=1 Tax=Methyloceanibacter sp. TaxID=1965321 RepID=UPI003D6D2391
MPKVKRFTSATLTSCKLPKGRGQIDFFENISQGRSLVLTLNKSGRRSWSALFYERGKPRRKKLGYFDYSDAEYPNLSCKQARDAALKFNAKGELAKRKAGSFAEVADQYLKRHVAAGGLRSEKSIRWHLDKYVTPRWGSRRFADIHRRDVAELMDEIVDEHGVVMADAVLAIVRGVMTWHQSRDGDYVSPVVPRMRRRAPVKRERWLADDEIRGLWQATDEPGTFNSLVRVLLLTGLRRSKVAAMRWQDVDLDTGEWRIPREEREKGTPEAITLTRTALEIVRAQQPRAENSFVFAGRGSAAFNAFSEGKRLLDQRIAKAGAEARLGRLLRKGEAPTEQDAIKDWRLHDLRRTCRGLMTRGRVPTEIAERTLGHGIKGVQAHYDNPKEYRRRIDEALRKVEVEVGKILEPGRKVVKFKVR